MNCVGEDYQTQIKLLPGIRYVLFEDILKHSVDIGYTSGRVLRTIMIFPGITHGCLAFFLGRSKTGGKPPTMANRIRVSDAIIEIRNKLRAHIRLLGDIKMGYWLDDIGKRGQYYRLDD